MPDERDINDAIFTGIIGLAFLFLELKSEIQNPVNFNYIRIVIFLFLAIGIARIYGVILNNKKIKFISITIFKLVFVPLSAFMFPIIITTQFLPLLTTDKLIMTEIALFVFLFSLLAFEYTGIKMYRGFIKKDLGIKISLGQFIREMAKEKISKWIDERKRRYKRNKMAIKRFYMRIKNFKLSRQHP